MALISILQKYKFARALETEVSLHIVVVLGLCCRYCFWFTVCKQIHHCALLTGAYIPDTVGLGSAFSN